ncbi:MAG TPA: SHOCT domain-containing protein, partial [Gracilimonas sp.]|uniref:SHOCT domain-containing protein n=1 Tax=Gracilimonas sp. TaxID=1974203 RepID=UPI002DA54DDC|nr:SHOCT domain-containing protein [Gracilimonas sp.]
SEDSLMEIILSSTPISFFAVIYLLVISTSFLPGFVLKFSTLNLGSKKINTVEDQLLHLKELRDRDLITEDEYNKKRQSIIENI